MVEYDRVFITNDDMPLAEEHFEVTMECNQGSGDRGGGANNRNKATTYDDNRHSLLLHDSLPCYPVASALTSSLPFIKSARSRLAGGSTGLALVGQHGREWRRANEKGAEQ
jgi:hypothetical protein